MSVRWQDRNCQTLFQLTYQQYIVQKAFMRNPETSEDDWVPPGKGKAKNSHIEMGKKNCCISPTIAILQSQHGLGWLEENTEFNASLEGKRRVERMASVPATQGAAWGTGFCLPWLGVLMGS